MSDQQAKKPLLGSCEACGHVWATVWTPCPVTDLPRRPKCPYCGNRAKESIFIASRERGDLVRYADQLRAELVRVEAEDAA